MTTLHRMPDFLVIGAGKSGTTSLDKYLDAHPSIFMSQRKDPGYFASEQYAIHPGMRPESIAYYQKFIGDEETYLQLFVDAHEHQLVGETSTIYLYSENGYDLIKKAIPSVKLIAILRQPAQRVFSRYLHLAREGLLPTNDFEDIFDRTSLWWNRPDLIPEGFYFKHLSRFFDHFPHENIKVLLYEDLSKSPESLFREIFGFLEVDETFVPKTDVTYNRSGIIKNQSINKIIGYNNPLFRVTKKLFPKQYESLRKTPAALKVLDKVRSKNLSKPKLTPELNQRIINDIYLEDIEKLEQLISKDLSHWKSVS